jgi:DNA polymerase-3 subunit chi
VKTSDGDARTTEIRFYTLKDAGGTARMRQACVLAEQAWMAGDRVLLWLAGTDELARCDDLLWTFGDRSFVPHEMLAADPAASEAPVQLHAGPLPEGIATSFGTLITLREHPEPAALQFASVIEVLDAEPACRNAGRARFRWYREQGVTPQHVEV